MDQNGYTSRTGKGVFERTARMDRAWHGKKIEKQARRMQQDQPEIVS